MSQTNKQTAVKKITIKAKTQDKPIIDSGGEVIKYPFDYAEFNARFIKTHGEDARCLKVGEDNINSKFGTSIGYSAKFGGYMKKYVKGDTCKLCGHTFGKGQERARHHFEPTRGKYIGKSMCYRYKNEGLADVNTAKAHRLKGTSAKSKKAEAFVLHAERINSPKFLKALKTIEVCVKKISNEEFDFQSVKYRDIIRDAFDVIGDYKTPKVMFGIGIGDFGFNSDVFDDGGFIITQDDVEHTIQCIRDAFDTASYKTQREYIVECYEAEDALDLYPETTIEDIIELQDDFDPFYE